MSLPWPQADSPPPVEAVRGLATWALQFTPRVAIVEEAVLMEVRGSLRLFGGAAALHERIAGEAHELGVTSIAWAPTGLGALALTRSPAQQTQKPGPQAGESSPQHSDSRRCNDADAEQAGLDTIVRLLDALPVQTLSAARPHLSTLARLGRRTLGELRALPRGGLTRRFGTALLAALDQAYGLRPELYAWHEAPARFAARIELMARVQAAAPMLFAARRLLLQLCGWLTARQCGVTAFTLVWIHDSMRSRDADERGSLTIRTAEPIREPEHLGRLLAEHLAKVVLSAPVGELELLADQIHPLPVESGSLLIEPGRHRGEALHRVLERIAARLGPDRVLRPELFDDFRPEAMVQWRGADGEIAGPAAPGPREKRLRIRNDAAFAQATCASLSPCFPQPTWILPEPLPLAVRGQSPYYQGRLQLLTGPHRIEGGWWDRTADAGGRPRARNVQRDYWIALSEFAGVLWIYQQRLAGEDSAWYLHGVFA